MRLLKLVKIEDIPDRDAYELTIAHNHNFYCNGILKHNCRLVTGVSADGKVTFKSREGNDYLTLKNLEPTVIALANIIRPILCKDPQCDQDKEVVFDGELSYATWNNQDDFKIITRMVGRKDFVIDKPRYHIFDALTRTEWFSGTENRTHSSRYAALCEMEEAAKKDPTINRDRYELVEQWPLTSKEQFDSLVKLAADSGWEGLILRKDVEYEAGRSCDMLKVKKMQDIELTCTGVEKGPFRVVSNGKEQTIETLTRIHVDYQGQSLDVGSGFSLDERRLYAEHPEQIIGKPVTVQYFQLTEDADGVQRLRFPVFKGIRDYE